MHRQIQSIASNNSSSSTSKSPIKPLPKRTTLDSDTEDSDGDDEAEQFDPEAHRAAMLESLPPEPPLGAPGVITVQVTPTMFKLFSSCSGVCVSRGG